MQSLTLPAPAKLNLFLHIVGRRPDGYHELQTVFQFISLCDTLTFARRADDELHISGTPDIPLHENIVFRAWEQLRIYMENALDPRVRGDDKRNGDDKTNGDDKVGVNIHIEKRIPQGGGLGGGSTDAATTLLALNHLWQLHLSVADLMQIGVRLGADVPVFIQGQAAWAEGIGDILTPVTDIAEPWYVIVNPQVSVNTHAMYASPELPRQTPRIQLQDWLRDHRAGISCYNDFTAVVTKTYPAVQAVFDVLAAFGEPRLTGSGGCVYLPCNNFAAAEHIIRQLPRTMVGYAAQGLNRSPLLDVIGLDTLDIHWGVAKR